MTFLTRETRRALMLLYPAAFGVAYVLLSFAHFPTPVGDLVRPVGVVIVGAFLLVLVLRLVLRTWSRSTIACQRAARGPQRSIPVRGGDREPSGAWISDTGDSRPARPRRVAADRRGDRCLGRLRYSGRRCCWCRWSSPRRRSQAPSTFATRVPLAEPAVGLPNVYLLLLDGYPRTDTLATTYGFDNSEFERAIERPGLPGFQRQQVELPAHLADAHQHAQR